MKNCFQHYEKISTGDRISVTRKLRDAGHVDTNFLEKLHRLSFEDVIALKVECSTRREPQPIVRALPIWSMIPELARAALLRWAYGAARDAEEGAALLGLSINRFDELIEQYNITSYFFDQDLDQFVETSSLISERDGP